MSSNNLSTTYNPNAFQPSYNQQPLNSNIQAVNINKPYEVTNTSGHLVGYFWYQGNSVDLCFELTGEVTLTEQDQWLDLSIFKDLIVECTIYDFRREPVLKFSNDITAEHKLEVKLNATGDGTDVTFGYVLVQLDRELSSSLAKGTYRISLEAYNLEGYHETLFTPEICTFEVR